MAKLTEKSIREAAHATFDYERDYQKRKFHGETCANPSISLQQKLAWITEEYLEVVTAINDGKPIHEIMHEIAQVGSMCQAVIEGYIREHPEFPSFVYFDRNPNKENTA